MKKWTFHVLHVKPTQRRGDGPYWWWLQLVHRRFFPHFFLFISFFTLYLSNAFQTFCSLKQASISRSSVYMSWTRKTTFKARAFTYGPVSLLPLIECYHLSNKEERKRREVSNSFFTTVNCISSRSGIFRCHSSNVEVSFCDRFGAANNNLR